MRVLVRSCTFSFFFLNDRAPPEFSPFPLHAPFPIWGANLALPFLNVREMRLNTAIARSQYEEAVVNFRKTLYAALAETEKSLSARTELAACNGDRKSTRLNSSHQIISYAVFCLKKKK